MKYVITYTDSLPEGFGSTVELPSLLSKYLGNMHNCSKVGGASNMKRWHFENCKNKGEVFND